MGTLSQIWEGIVSKDNKNFRDEKSVGRPIRSRFIRLWKKFWPKNFVVVVAIFDTFTKCTTDLQLPLFV
jgi:hypothetical protein